MRNLNQGFQKGWLLVAVSLSFSTFSCELFKPAADPKKEKVYTEEDISDLQGTKVFDATTGEWRTVREVNGKVETVKWTDLDERKYPPITSDGTWTSEGGKPNEDNAGTGGGGQYNVSLVLPFLANTDSASIHENSSWAIQFYSGAKLAYEDLAKGGAKIHVNVADTEGSTSKTAQLIGTKAVKNADLIIGPYKKDNVALFADFSKKEKKPLVVPFTAQYGMAEGNPNYIQVNPSLESHCKAITRHAREKYRIEDIVLVARDDAAEKARLAFFQNENQVIEGRSVGVRFTEYIVTDQSLDFSKMNISPYIREGKRTVFIVPSWNESFVYSLLRQLMLKRSIGEEVVVYGMPQWEDFEQVDPEFYQNLNVRISNAFYIDDSDEKVRQFKRKYFDTYGTIPLDEAYLGYDNMLYFGKMLNKYGKDFPTKIDSEPYDVLHGRFEFGRVVLKPEAHKEDLKYYDQLENQFVHILEFRDYRFQPVR